MRNHSCTLAVILILITHLIFGQEAVIPSGNDLIGSGGSINYSVGQVLYTQINGTTGFTIQGVQQPYEISNVLSRDDLAENIYIQLIPNPTTRKIMLTVMEVSHGDLSYQLYDLTGKLLKQNPITSVNTHIDLSNLPTAIYMLKIIEDNYIQKVYKVLKI